MAYTRGSNCPIWWRTCMGGISCRGGAFRRRRASRSRSLSAKAQRGMHRTQEARRCASDSERDEPEADEACTARKSRAAARAAARVPSQSPARGALHARAAPPEKQRARRARAQQGMHRTQESRRRASDSERDEPEADEASTARKSRAAARAAARVPSQSQREVPCTQEPAARAAASAPSQGPAKACTARKSHAAA